MAGLNLKKWNSKKMLLFLSFLAISVGLLAIIGWVFNISVLKSVYPGLPPMRFNPALVLICLGMSLFLLINEKLKLLVKSLCVLVIIYSIACIYEDFFKVQLGIDEFFVKDNIALSIGYPPGRAPVSASICFIMMASAFFIFSTENKKNIIAAQFLLHSITFICFIIILGYILNSSSLQKLYFFTTMALNMAIMLLAISIGASLLHTDKGITAVFAGKKTGNIMAKRLFPQMILFLILISFLRTLAYQNKWVTEELGIALVIMSFSVITLLLIWHNANNLNDLDDKRQIAETAIKSLNFDLEKTVKDLADYKYALEESTILSATDENGIIHYVNDNFCKTGKYSREELIGQNHQIINSGYHSKDFFGRLWSTITNGKIWRGEVRNKTKDGTFYWVDTTIVPFLDANGKPYKFLAIRSDITERIRFIEKLKLSKKVYRDLYENSLVAILTTDIKTRKPISVNDVAVELFGYGSKEDFLEKFDSVSHFANPKEREINLKMMNGKDEIRNKLLEMKKADGTTFWAKLFVKLHKNIAQVVIIDVTEQVRSRETLTNKIKELETANKELESFNYVSSHDLQEPLRQIKNFVSILRKNEQKNLTDEGRYYLERMSMTSQQMQALIEDLLAYSRTKNAVRNFEMADLNTILEKAIANFNGLIKEKGIIIKSGRLCVPNVISFQIHQLFSNLISNSIKFSHPERSLQINIKSETALGCKLNEPQLLPQLRYCHITFQDNGIGFEPQYKDRIFEIFERLHAREKYSGTGIGLAICKRIVENHNGFITATGELGKGAQFDIYLPCK